MDTVVVRTTARRVDVTGDDRASYLENVTSQHIVDVPVTHVRSALVLDPHGAPTAMFDVVVLGDRLVLLAPDDEVAATLTDVLGMRTFLADARFEATDAVVASVRGDDAEHIVRGAGLTVVEGRCRLAGELLLVSRPGGIDLVGAEHVVTEAMDGLVEAGARRGTEEDLEARRVAAGVPRWGREVVAPHLPEEAGLLPTHVHLAKGCYPGQEAVARMWMLGRPRRRLAVVRVSGAVTPGWEAGDGRRKVTVTSVSPQEPLALAFVPSDAAPGDRLPQDAAGPEGADEVGIEVVRLIGDDAAPPGHDPAVVRRRDKARV